jgi:ADP-dependent NAD(P)H-hydrate dehydratase
MRRIDPAWIDAHPLPPIAAGSDKNGRGRVLVVGGAEFVPGALRLTGEAALRAGAGKLQMATVKAAAMSLAVLMPEAAMIALPADADGEIASDAVALIAERLARCDALIMGPGMSAAQQTSDLVSAVLRQVEDETIVILDAAALTCASDLQADIKARRGRVIITPHHGELSYLTGTKPETIAADPAYAAREVADEYQAIVLLKGVETFLAAPSQETLLFDGGCAGLATGGSGDVLAGIIGGLAARSADPIEACAWGTFIHGQAGVALSRQVGTIGFLARELLPLIPRLIDEASKEPRAGD